MATPDETGTLPPASTSQTSTDNSQTESSAARCCVFQQKQKTLGGERLFRAQSQPENTSASNNVNFQDSGENPVSVSTSAANTGRHAVSATWVNGRYSASYRRYLKRKNQMKSHFRELKRQRQTEQLICRLDDVRRQLLMLTELHKRKCQNMN